MTSRWPGVVRELDVRVEWRLAFVPHGTQALPGDGVVYLDVGGSFQPGVVDHHQGGPAGESATGMVVQRPDYVYQHLRRDLDRHLSSGGRPAPWRPTIVTHQSPDFDAIAATYLVMRLVEDGDLPEHARSLSAYADRIDQGREPLQWEVDPRPSLYALVLMLSNLSESMLGELWWMLPERRVHEGQRSRHDMVLCIGLHLMELCLSAREGSGRAGIRFGNEPADWVLDGPQLESPTVQLLHSEFLADAARFRELVASGHIRTERAVSLPQGRGRDLVPLGVGSIREYHRLAGNKLYLRARGPDGTPTPVTVIRGWKFADGGDGAPRQWIVALDPAASIAHSGLSLRGLGASLEIAEQRARRELDPRTGIARFPEYPGIADPWYDGRAHAFGIVESPNCGSLLSFEDVLRTLQGRFWEPEVSFARVQVSQGDESNGSAWCFDATGGHVWRLGDVQCRLETLRSGRDSEADRLACVHVDASEAWGEAPLLEFASTVVGVASAPIEIAQGRAFVGPSGVLLLAPESARCTEALHRGVARLARLLHELEQIELDLRIDGQPTVADSCRTLRMEHVRAVATYWSDRGAAADPDALQLLERLEFATAIETRIRGVGDLLKHLDDDAQRRQSARLNRIVFIVGSFGLIEALGAALEGWGLASDAGSWPTFILELVLPILFALLCMLALMSFSRRFCGWMARSSRLRELFFDDVLLEERRPSRRE
jgi:hypothetical protein